MIYHFLIELDLIESRYFSRLKWAEEREKLRTQYPDLFCRYV